MRLNAAVQGVPLLELRELVANLERAGCHGAYFAEISHDPFLAVAAERGRDPDDSRYRNCPGVPAWADVACLRGPRPDRGYWWRRSYSVSAPK